MKTNRCIAMMHKSYGLNQRGAYDGEKKDCDIQL